MFCWCSTSSSSSIRLVLWQNWKTLFRHSSSLHCPVKVKPYFAAIPRNYSRQTETMMESPENDKATQTAAAAVPMSKNAQRRFLKQQRFELKKAEKKSKMKEHKKREAEQKRKEWEDRLAGVGEAERERLTEERRRRRKEHLEKLTEEKGKKMERLQEARANGQNLVIDLEFAHLMSPIELKSLVQQIMYCYAINGKCAVPAHIWLTGCLGEMQNQLLQITGFDKWLIEKEEQSYVEAFKDRKENLVYLTADSENVLGELDPKEVYIIGGLVDRNRWKGITMKKAIEQGIRTAKLPIGAYLKMSSSQVLTVNQVVEILLKFLEKRDWKDSCFQVIPLRKRPDNEDDGPEVGRLDNENNAVIEDQKVKRQCIET